jgi:hypothetical protein
VQAKEGARGTALAPPRAPTMQRDRAASSSPFGTPQQPPGRGRSELQNPSTGKPPRHTASSVSKDSARRSSARNLASSALMSPGAQPSPQRFLRVVRARVPRPRRGP